MATLEKAISIAAEAHAGTLDKGGKHYILHPLRVMMNVETIDEKIVAILHDVVEDTHWSFESLASEGFSKTILDALKSVTRGDETYSAFIERARNNPIGCKVKIADIKDNLDVRRLNGKINTKDQERLNKYLKALKQLDAL